MAPAFRDGLRGGGACCEDTLGGLQRLREIRAEKVPSNARPQAGMTVEYASGEGERDRAPGQ